MMQPDHLSVSALALRDDTRDFIAACRQRSITPHVASNDTGSAAASLLGERPGTAATIYYLESLSP